jgi:hypothetical protein
LACSAFSTPNSLMASCLDRPASNLDPWPSCDPYKAAPEDWLPWLLIVDSYQRIGDWHREGRQIEFSPVGSTWGRAANFAAPVDHRPRAFCIWVEHGIRTQGVCFHCIAPLPLTRGVPSSETLHGTSRAGSVDECHRAVCSNRNAASGWPVILESDESRRT